MSSENTSAADAVADGGFNPLDTVSIAEVPDTVSSDSVAPDSLPSRGLLSFYDRLRARIIRAVERRGGRFSAGAAEALLLVPDVFMLVVRLALDKDVPQETRVLLGSTLVYFVVPVDFLPEAMIGAAGYLDDLVLAVAVLSQAFGEDLEPFAERYWSGSQSLRNVFRDILAAAQSLVGYNVYERLRGALAKRGIEIDEGEDYGEEGYEDEDPSTRG